MVVRREKYKLHLFCFANFKENGEKITILGGSRHIITQSNAGVNIMVFSNLHTHNNQRDTIGISSFNIKGANCCWEIQKIWCYQYTFTSINFLRHKAVKLSSFAKVVLQILTLGLSSGDLTSTRGNNDEILYSTAAIWFLQPDRRKWSLGGHLDCTDKDERQVLGYAGSARWCE